MTETDIVHIGVQALTVAAKLSGPLLLASLAVGVVVSLLQVVFQVQDQMLSMVPRLAVGAAVLMLTGGWMLRVLVEFTQQLFRSIPGLLH
jgi:flagellar biosynthetic protein FliQ